jgi:hypothetical protein
MEKEQSFNDMDYYHHYFDWNHRCDYYQEQEMIAQKRYSFVAKLCIVAITVMLVSIVISIMSSWWIWFIGIPLWIATMWCAIQAFRAAWFSEHEWHNAFTETHEYLDTLNGHNF